MNTRPLLLAIGLLALSTSCDKEPDTTTIEGQVVDRVNSQPVPNSTVQMHVTPNTGAGAYRAVGDPHACDAQGRFSFAAEALGGHVILMAHSAQGHYTAYGEAPEVREGRKNKKLRVPVYSPSWLRFNLVDEPPRSRVWIDIGGSNTLSAILPYPRDTVFVRPITGGENYRVYWQINVNGVRTPYWQDVNVPALDTLNIRIPF